MKKTNSSYSPFNCIAMKDIKDKNSNKGDLRPLFDCVSSIGEAIEKLKAYLDRSPDNAESISAHVNSLIDIQENVLSTCLNNVSQQKDYVPDQGNGDAGVEGVEGGPGTDGEQEVEIPLTQKPVSKPSKIRLK